MYLAGVVDLLFYVRPIVYGGSFALLYVLSSFEIILTRKRELVALLFCLLDVLLL